MISVVIPVYNRADRIIETIENVYQQMYKDIEVIVVDDGSSDNIEDVLRNYNRKHFKYIKSPTNMGACHARNLGVSNSQGEYIAFQDSDDLWHPEKLSKQLTCLVDSHADICICRMNNRYSDGTEKEFHSKSFSQKSITLENELASSFFSTQIILGKKECFLEQPFDERFPRFQDWDLGIRLVKHYNIVLIDEVLAYRLIQKDSLSHNFTKGYTAGKLLLEKYSEDFSKYPKAESAFLCFYSQFQEAVGESSHDNLKKALSKGLSCKLLIKYITQYFGIYGKYIRKSV